MKTVKVSRLFASFLILLSAGLIIGCSNAFDEINTTEVNTTPFANQALLEEIAQNDTFVHWKVARFFALNELDDSRAENSWDGAWLSDYPLVIYNAETGNPRFYEFRVLQGDTEVGAISCAVDKGEGAPVQFVLPFVHEVASQNARSLVNNTGKFVDSGYPGRLLIQDQNGGSFRSADTGTDAGDISGYPADAKVLDFLLNASKEELELLGIDSDEIYQKYLATEQEKAEQLALFWQEVDALNDKIIGMTEEELQEAFNTETGAGRSVSTAYTGQFFLNDWVNKSGWPDAGGYCGPNVIAFIMLGLGTKSGYPNIPTSNNNGWLINYYQTIENRMGEGMQWPFPILDWDSMDGWLREFTGGRYGISTHIGFNLYPPFLLTHDWGLVNYIIRRNQLPAISCRLPKSIEDCFDSTKGCHYRTIIGTREAKTALSTKILWWTVTVPLWWEGQYLMHDNGADSKDAYWWEGWTLYQWFAMSVVRN